MDPRLSGVDRLVLYDGVYRFCNTWVNLALRIDTERGCGMLRYSPWLARHCWSLLGDLATFLQ